MNDYQKEFDFDHEEPSKWPENSKFPINFSGFGENRTVESEVLKDIEYSKEYLIITGFTSLSNIIEKFGFTHRPNLEKLRIVLGWEPNPHGRKRYPIVELSKEIKEYWLKEGLSIIYGGAIIRLIELIKEGIIEFRYRNKLHAKIYIGQTHAILGSANFSINGLTKQEEANIRIAKTGQGVRERDQYEAVSIIAQNFYELALPYNDEAIKLLQDLIQKVTWEEALARAISEVIEGEWLSEYAQLFDELSTANLWPTQWKGIAQAMSVIQSHSNVLIADPTGAGKTKLASALLLTLVHWLWLSGKQHRSSTLIICPPLVIPNWRNEFRDLSHVNHAQISMWMYSNAGKAKTNEAIKDMDLANIIAIDEAHNFLNPDSNRSKAIQHRKADHTILLTATPINKKAEDLLRLIELLDVDNLSDSDYKLYKELRKKKKKFDKEDVQSLKSFISQFIVRRTKFELNKEIIKEPQKYHNKEGKACRFPIQNCLTYKTKETKDDIQIAYQIDALAKKLKGVIYLRKILQPEWELKNEEEERNYIEKRIHAASALTGYMVKSALRSSRAALVEHVCGSDAAMEYFEFKTNKNKTGDQLTKIAKFKKKLPRINLSLELFPMWLVDLYEYEKVCEEEIEIYQEIAELAKKISNKRELGKVKHLLKLQRKHSLIVAFDSTVITLDYLKSLFINSLSQSTVYVVSGTNTAVRDMVLEKFKLGSNSKNCIALCSDQMSEGVNLQQASAVVLLDMPSVLRIAEQRIGRIDRMDSPHDEIEAFWPDDAEIFSLKGDQRLIDTNILVENIYGSNISLPKVLRDRHFKDVDSVESIIEEYKRSGRDDVEWEGITNSFKPVILLKEGDEPLIPEEYYEQFKNVESTIRSRVGFVNSAANWCFFALRGTKTKSPMWYFIDAENVLHTEFPDICKQLRIHLQGESENIPWDQKVLEKFIFLMRAKEKELLPHKKKRALNAAELIIKMKIKKVADQTNSKLLQEVQKLFKPQIKETIVDYYEFAAQWIEILQPYLNEKRRLAKRTRQIYNLESLIRDHNTIILSNEDLQEIIDNCPYTDQIDQKIASCIIGVAN